MIDLFEKCAKPSLAAEAKRQVRLADGRITSDQVLKEAERA